MVQKVIESMVQKAIERESPSIILSQAYISMNSMSHAITSIGDYMNGISESNTFHCTFIIATQYTIDHSINFNCLYSEALQ